MSEELKFEETSFEETKKATDEKCPYCGGTVEFDPSSGGLLCPYCDSKIEIKAETAQTESGESMTSAQELDFESALTHANCDWGVAKKTIICKSCGGESIYDELELSNKCPYCDSNQVMEEKDVNTLAPGGVCLFKVDKKKAGERFTSWIKGKWFCPSEAKKKAKPESFKGVYLPAWTFDAETYTTYTAQYGKERRVRNSKGETRTVIDWYTTSGSYQRFINDNMQYATVRYDMKMMKKLAPFDTEDNLLYKPEYIAGFISERYSVGLADSWEKAKVDINYILKRDIEDKIEREHSTSHVRGIMANTQFSDIKYKYLMLPIWLSSFRYKDKIYQFMVNGQTGKVAGKTPISPLRVCVAVLIALAVLGLVAYIYTR